MTTESEPAALRGRILTHLAGPAECGGSAVMIRSDSSPVTGLAWASLDQTCRLHYTVRLEGSDSLHSAQPSLELEDYPIQRPSNLKARPLFPSTKRHLQDCVGPRCSGHADNIHKLMMARLDSGDAAFLLTNSGENPFQVKVSVLFTTLTHQVSSFLVSGRSGRRVSATGLSAEVRQERPGDHPGLPQGPGGGDRRRGAGGEHETEMCLRGVLL